MQSQPQAASLPGEQAAATSDERVWAALAHASVLLMFFGPLVPLILWTTQRKKSAYASFHALQAMAYQALFFWVWIIVVPLLIIAITLIAIVVVAATNPQSAEQPLAVFAMQIAIFGTFIGSMLLFMAAGIVGAVACLSGREFRYPFFGGRLARYLEYQGAEGSQMPDAQQDQLVAAVSHSTCVVLLWGLITPLVAWLTQRERSQFLRFQALQASIYQVLGALAYFVVFGLYMVSMLGVLGAAMALGNDSGSAGAGWLAAFMIPIFCVVCVAALAVPLYHLFGFLAALATLRGRDYRYPVLGSILARRMKMGEST